MSDLPVLVTGATGYIAVHLVKQLLERGYKVRGSVRSLKKAEHLKVLFSKEVAEGRLEFVVVEDIAKPGAFDDAVQGVSGVFHTASPFFYADDILSDPQSQLIDPAVNGTMSALVAAKKVPTVKRVVVTSSFAAIVKQNVPSTYDFSEVDWNESSKPDMGGVHAYRASKTFAERAAWNFIETEKPSFTLATINPPLVLGPVIQETSLSTLNTSVNNLYTQYFSPNLTKTSPVPPPGVGMGFVDVRDVALAHILAFELPEAGGERFVVSEGTYNWQEIAEIIHKVVPEERKDNVPIGIHGARVPMFTLNNAKSKKVLGLKYHTLEQTLKDTVDSVLALE